MERIAVDWDGTLVTNVWPKQSYEWMPGAVEALRELTRFAEVFIYTSRIAKGPEGAFPEKSPAQVQMEKNYIQEMLDSVGLGFIEIWDKPWKPGAMAYVDDKAVHYSGRKTAWPHLVDKLATMAGREDLLDNGFIPADAGNRDGHGGTSAHDNHLAAHAG